MLKPKSKSQRGITIDEDDGIKFITAIQKTGYRRCVSVPECLFDVQSIMKFRTLDESLHSTYGGSENGSKSGDRTLQFDKIEIREYARTIGDNPSCSSGPPVSISWEYTPVGKISLDEYEETRPPRRSHFEMVLPRKVRHDMLRREWDVPNKYVAEAVRRNVKVKNQRKATVNNLGKATKMEEALESVSRKLKRIIFLQKPVHQQVKILEKKLDDAQRRRSQLVLERAMAGEYSEGGTEESSPVPPEKELSSPVAPDESSPEAVNTSSSSL